MEVEHLLWLLGAGFATLALGTVAALFPAPRSRMRQVVSYVLAALGAGALAAGSLGALVAGRTLQLGQFTLLPAVSPLQFRIDPLSALFVLLITGLGVAGSIYAIGYTAGQTDSSPALWNLFIGSMAGVAFAGDGLGFLLAWELMSIVSFLLVMADHRDPEVRQAGYFYVVMTHVGTAFLIGAFLTLFAKTGALDFAAFRTAAAGLPGGVRSALFLLALVGFGTKAGLVPLHVWLPRAHPAAPSHVSALMSGAMVKTAIYGLLRFAFDVLGGGPAWWGGLLILLGGLSAVTGVLYATQQSHLKRLLAYSTVENIGLMFMGLGAALWARAAGHDALAALALGAVLFHAVSHACFKGLAFMGAGAVLHGTGTADMEKLGGLIRPMPRTAAFALLAVTAIAGLPPLSGFVGEWLSLQTFFGVARSGAAFLPRLGGLAAVAAIALSAGLAAAAAVKLFGITFLARPRSSHTEHAHDASPAMLAGMALPAAAVLAFGFFPGPVLTLARQVVSGLLGDQTGALVPAGLTLAVAPGTDLAPLYAPAAVLLLTALAILAVIWFGRGWPHWRQDLTWTCGIEPNARMEYSGAGYTKPILLMFKGLIQPERSLQMDRSVHPFFPGEARYRSELRAAFEQRLYRPVTKAIMETASRLRRLQTGSLQTYLLYLLVAAVAVIIAAR